MPLFEFKFLTNDSLELVLRPLVTSLKNFFLKPKVGKINFVPPHQPLQGLIIHSFAFEMFFQVRDFWDLIYNLV